MIKVLQKENAILRKIAKEVKVENIPTAEIQKIISDMKKVLDKELDGVAIAAPQIGISLRIFLISKRAEIITKGLENLSPKEKETFKDLIYINPKIIKQSTAKNKVEEGCLSVRYLYGKVNRSKKATITAYDENGKKFTQGGSGLMAQIFQHEVDHLNGILFIDKAEDIIEIRPDQINKK